MKPEAFVKNLSSTDCGLSNTHQGGMLIPRSDEELLAFMPTLDPNIKNPNAIFVCIDEDGGRWEFNFVYYNNKRRLFRSLKKRKHAHTTNEHVNAYDWHARSSG